MAATMMSNIQGVLGSVVRNLSEENYEQSFAQYRFLVDMARTCSQIPTDLIFDTVWNKISDLQLPSHGNQRIFYPTSPLLLRFASDAESDSVLAPYSAGLRGRLCTSVLRQFYGHGLGVLYLGGSPSTNHLLCANLIAHAVNLGYIEETVIREHILQFLTSTSGPAGYPYQELALLVLFKTAGATFDASADPSVVDRCFELLKGHDLSKYGGGWQQLKVGRLYEANTWLELRQVAGGGIPTTGTWLGGSASVSRTA